MNNYISGRLWENYIHLNSSSFFSGDVEELEIQEKPALKVFKNITVIQEPGMVVLEVRYDHLPRRGGNRSFKSSCIIVEKMSFFPISKIIVGKYTCVYFSFEYNIGIFYVIIMT